MSKANKNPASRLPVDAFQYEKLALSAFDLCDRQLSQLESLISLATSVLQQPAVTNEEVRRRQSMLERLVQTGEQYLQELACDRELFQVIALDAKGIAHTRITANLAEQLLKDATRIATDASAANGAANVPD